jgi:hypothetical protein
MSEDDPDWTEFVNDRRTLSETDCARLRWLLRGSTRRISELSEGRFEPYSRTQLSKHANGYCAHDHGIPAVEVERRWVPRE